MQTKMRPLAHRRGPHRDSWTPRLLAVAVTGLFLLLPANNARAIEHLRATTPPSGCNPRGQARYEASRQLPPRALRRYIRSYCDDFRGPRLSLGWGKFAGNPSGNPGAMFLPSHVSQTGGILTISTYRDAANGGNWATGGVCECAIAQTYGAYFVRSEITGGGVDNDEMLWPAQHVWPPEVDFNETTAGTHQTDSFVHYHADNEQIAHQISIDLTKWHTWGVVWTPSQVIFTIDGHAWSTVTEPSAIPRIPMTLDLQEQTYCATGAACPTRPVSMKIDWVTEFAPAHR